MRRRLPAPWSRLLLGLVALVGVAALAAVQMGLLGGGAIGPDTDVPAAAPEAPARWGRARSATVTQTFAALGTVEAQETSEISARLRARVAEVRVDVGDSVEAGTLLARLEAPATAARVRQAEEALARARAERRRADRAYARARRLHARQAATERRLDEARAAAEAARAATRRAKGALSEARAVLDRARVRAPARGRVREVHVDPGDLAAPGRPLLVLQTPGAAHLRAYVREGLATRIAVGDTLETRVPAASFEGAAVVERIAPAVDPRSRAFAIEVGLPADGRLLPGMFGRVEVPARARPTVWVPDTAIRRVGQLELVRARAGGGAWGLRHVTTGRTRGDEVEVLSGLEGGERVALGRGGAEP